MKIGPPVKSGLDSASLDAIIAAVMKVVFSRDNLLDLLHAIESVSQSNQRIAPGQLYVGTVSALAFDANNLPITAMVAIHGAATLTACYVPPHISPWIAVGQDVFITAVNGNMADPMIDSIRNISTALAPNVLTPIVNSNDTQEQMGFGLYGSTDVGVSSNAHAAVLGGTGGWIKINNKWNGVNDLFTQAAQASQFNVTNTGLQFRTSSNATPTVGAIVTWNAWQTITIP